MNWRLPFRPAAVFQVAGPESRTRDGLVEVDLDPLSLQMIQLKVRALEAYLPRGRLTGYQCGEMFDVYLLAVRSRRLADLRQAIRKLVAECRWIRYHFATTDILDLKQFALADWLDLDGTRHPFLHDLAGSS